ncbi:hypothetical protein MSG28_002679 [Choristoneura fumiferana]|uniref:Uncharacterized protein n=1 Tax=Choristoneura fumiferana TaxID=7141 RepID=A0ACC0JIY4_CHOFU|nr:hypothetical protein MSG28_002679 [Choristoneura fumiferana]
MFRSRRAAGAGATAGSARRRASLASQALLSTATPSGPQWTPDTLYLYSTVTSINICPSGGATLGYRYQKIWGSERFDRWCYWSSRRATGEYCVKGKATTTTEFTPLLLENRIINAALLAASSSPSLSMCMSRVCMWSCCYPMRSAISTGTDSFTDLGLHGNVSACLHVLKDQVIVLMKMMMKTRVVVCRCQFRREQSGGAQCAVLPQPLSRVAPKTKGYGLARNMSSKTRFKTCSFREVVGFIVGQLI